MTLCATFTVDIQNQDALNATPVYTLYFGISCRSTYTVRTIVLHSQQGNLPPCRDSPL